MVPVGLTRHRERLPQLRTLTAAEARDLADTIDGWQREFLTTLGTRFVWASDEVYLQAGLPLPSAAVLRGLPGHRGRRGAGAALQRRIRAPARRRLARPLASPRAVTVVTGTMFAPRMRACWTALRVDGLRVELVPVVNDWFGHGIGVAGLLTGQDIRRSSPDGPSATRSSCPPSPSSDGAGVFLDDLAPADLARSLGVPVRAVEPSSGALVGALVAAHLGR